ncbi:hypothetical protein TSOC_014925 [Tetrabaena socialis]|uniref:Uncharacterized protein n=1 Tax=Tetrabaena socialis TaxID=47790 RepID=A0A2J7ZGF1_9CHLO|nr:hypothetical protein TSOC_014925 [Tetrabaena socialis]|eukprot:PNG99299.1 hypothetical protein TSOC_014925 [Tetrabaena socialis]
MRSGLFSRAASSWNSQCLTPSRTLRPYKDSGCQRKGRSDLRGPAAAQQAGHALCGGPQLLHLGLA